jgi:16S rRNA (guanine527-N7)-methyltransferase
VEAVASRVEDYRPSVGFDLVLARAFSSLSEIRTMVAHLLGSEGRVLALKGQYPRGEVEALQGAVDVRVHALAIPGLAVERHLVEFGVG